MDYRNILATGFLLLCGAVFVHSLKSANAFPQGPNISMGTNPIENFYDSCLNYSALYTNNSTQTFVITDVVHGAYNYTAYLRIDSNLIYKSDIPNGYNFVSGLKVEPGETVECDITGRGMTISGYYAH